MCISSHIQRGYHYYQHIVNQAVIPFTLLHYNYLLCTISVSISGVRLSSLSTAHHSSPCKRSRTINTLEHYFTSGQNHNVDDNASSCKKTKLCNFEGSNEVGVVRDSQSRGDGEVCVVMVSS